MHLLLISTNICNFHFLPTENPKKQDMSLWFKKEVQELLRVRHKEILNRVCDVRCLNPQVSPFQNSRDSYILAFELDPCFIWSVTINALLMNERKNNTQKENKARVQENYISLKTTKYKLPGLQSNLGLLFFQQKKKKKCRPTIQITINPAYCFAIEI